MLAVVLFVSAGVAWCFKAVPRLPICFEGNRLISVLEQKLQQQDLTMLTYSHVIVAINGGVQPFYLSLS